MTEIKSCKYTAGKGKKLSSPKMEQTLLVWEGKHLKK